MSGEKKPFWAKCRACSHCWPAGYLPMEATAFCKIAMRAYCPMCGEGKPWIAKQDNGVLQEPTLSTGPTSPQATTPGNRETPDSPAIPDSHREKPA